MRIGIMGASLWTGNRGVSALATSLATLIWRARPDATITALIGNRDSRSKVVEVDGTERTVQTVNYRLSPMAPLGQQLWWIVLLSAAYRLVPLAWFRRTLGACSPWIAFVRSADFVGDIRGGDSFSDIYGAKAFVLGSLPAVSVIWIRGDISLLPQTYGPFRSRLASSVARYILMRAQPIWCRDTESCREVSRITGGLREASLCPDVAFSLEPVRPSPVEMHPPIDDRQRETLIGLNINGLVYNGGYSRNNMFGLALDYRNFVERLLLSLLTVPSNRVLLVPHTFAPSGSVESDPAACQAVIAVLPSRLRSRVHLVTAEYNERQIKGVIGQCDFFVGSRMHACIAALSQGVPTVGVAYSRKFAGVFDTVGAVDWVIDGRSISEDAAVARVARLLTQRDLMAHRLRAAVPDARRRLSEAFRSILGQIHEQGSDASSTRVRRLDACEPRH